MSLRGELSNGQSGATDQRVHCFKRLLANIYWREREYYESQSEFEWVIYWIQTKTQDLLIRHFEC